MYQNVIDFNSRRPLPLCIAEPRAHRSSFSTRAREHWQTLIAAAELFVTAAIGVCVLFCIGLTLSML